MGRLGRVLDDQDGVPQSDCFLVSYTPLARAGFTKLWLVLRATLHKTSLERLPREVIVVRAQVQAVREHQEGGSRAVSESTSLLASH